MKKTLLTSLLLGLFFNFSFAQNFTPFQGRINSEEINVRTGSTVNSEIICKEKKGAEISVVSEAYEWYKVQLPKNAPIFVNKTFLAAAVNTNEKTTPALNPPPLNSQPQPQLAKVLKDNVNIRLGPNEKSSIIGKLAQGQAVTVINITGDWAQIIPVQNSFGWVNKKFVDRIPTVETPKTKTTAKKN
ncbi:MAG: SH3 domain-containing protein [Candidatus Omnitrophica bacterium]|nr:SH3 domain-containing protein [Candidatus Omnitrophota bacterium]